MSLLLIPNSQTVSVSIVTQNWTLGCFVRKVTQRSWNNFRFFQLLFSMASFGLHNRKEKLFLQRTSLWNYDLVYWWRSRGSVRCLSLVSSPREDCRRTEVPRSWSKRVLPFFWCWASGSLFQEVLLESVMVPRNVLRQKLARAVLCSPPSCLRLH